MSEKRVTQGAFGDAFVIAVLTGCVLAVAVRWDLHERLSDYVAAHEAWELDEAIMVCIFLAAGLFVYSIRRLLDIRAQLIVLKTTQKTLEKSQESLRRSQKLDAVGQLAGGVAHDFNNLLLVILVNSEELVEALDDHRSLRTSAVEIHKACQRAARLTQQLLAFSRRQTL